MGAVNGWNNTRRPRRPRRRVRARRGWRTPQTMLVLTVCLGVAVVVAVAQVPLGATWMIYPISGVSAAACLWINAPGVFRRLRRRPGGSVDLCTEQNCGGLPPDVTCRCSCGGRRHGSWLQ